MPGMGYSVRLRGAAVALSVAAALVAGCSSPPQPVASQGSTQPSPPATTDPGTSSQPSQPLTSVKDSCGLTAVVVTKAVGQRMLPDSGGGRPGKVRCTYIAPDHSVSLGVDLPAGGRTLCQIDRWSTYTDEPQNEQHQAALRRCLHRWCLQPLHVRNEVGNSLVAPVQVVDCALVNDLPGRVAARRQRLTPREDVSEHPGD